MPILHEVVMVTPHVDDLDDLLGSSLCVFSGAHELRRQADPVHTNHALEKIDGCIHGYFIPMNARPAHAVNVCGKVAPQLHVVGRPVVL